MRIGIDARFYGPLGKGLGRYTQKLVDYLAEIDHENEYFIFLRQENWADFVTFNPKFKKILADYQWYTLAEQIYLPRLISKVKVDLMHFPHFNVPIFYTGKFVVTIHDLIITSYPTRRASTLGPFLYQVKQWGYGLVIHCAVRRAKKIITVSQYSRQEILKHFHLKPEKVIVTYEAAYGPLEKVSPSHQNPAEIIKKYQLKKPYLLYVGNAYPHKNLEALIWAWPKIKIKYPQLHFVLVGKEDYFYQRLKEEVKKNNLADRFIFADYVPDDDLRVFYEQAMAYIFPSLCEGFGLPPLEAMALGCPVISSQSSCLPEILGGAVLYFDPCQINGIIEAITIIMDDEQGRVKLAQKGLSHVQQFSWTKMARLTLNIYHEILSRVK